MIQFMIKTICQIQNTEMQVQKYKYSNTKIHKYKVQERPGMCCILKKHMLQGFQKQYSNVSSTEIQK